MDLQDRIEVNSRTEPNDLSIMNDIQTISSETLADSDETRYGGFTYQC